LRDIEIILIDDGSSDRSGNICDEYARIDPRIRCVHKRNGGEGSARNAGIRLAQGEYIAFVDSDDYIEAEMLSAMYGAAASQDADIVNCGYYKEKPNGIGKPCSIGFEKHTVLRHNELVRMIYSSAYQPHDYFFVWRNIYRRRLLHQKKILHDESIRYGTDTLFNLSAFYSAGSVYCIPDCFYHYVDNRSGKMCSGQKVDYLAHLTATHESRLEFYNSIAMLDIEVLRGLNARVIETSLMELVLNAWRCPTNIFCRELELIRNSKLISKALLTYHRTGNVGLFTRSVIALLRRRMYLPVCLVFYIRFFGRRRA